MRAHRDQEGSSRWLMGAAGSSVSGMAEAEQVSRGVGGTLSWGCRFFLWHCQSLRLSCFPSECGSEGKVIRGPPETCPPSSAG